MGFLCAVDTLTTVLLPPPDGNVYVFISDVLFSRSNILLTLSREWLVR